MRVSAHVIKIYFRADEHAVRVDDKGAPQRRARFCRKKVQPSGHQFAAAGKKPVHHSPESARLVRDALHELRSDERAIILCTHNLAEAEELAARIAIIRNGKIIANGTPAELRAQHAAEGNLEDVFMKLTEGAAE